MRVSKSVSAGWPAWLLLGLLLLAPSLEAAYPKADAVALSSQDYSPRYWAQKLGRLASHIGARYGVSNTQAREIVTEAIQQGLRHRLQPEFILAIIAIESAYRPRTVSHMGAMGLMQVMPGAHPQRVRRIGGEARLFEPALNIAVGTEIMAHYIALSRNDLRKALLRYNGNSRPLADYPNKVMKVYRQLRTVSRYKGS